MKIKSRLTPEQRYNKQIDEWHNIQKYEYDSNGLLGYDPTKSIYDNLFRCDSPGCLFKNLYYKELKQHINSGLHFFGKK
jgi:hypothetical protein